MIRASLLLSLAATTGCYTYRPLAQTDPMPGQAVRVLLTPEGTDQVTRILGPRLAELDGRVASVGADSVQLQVRAARSADLIESYFKDDVLVLSRSGIASIMAKKLAAGPTIALGGLAVAGAVGAAMATSGEGTSNVPPPPGGGVGAE